MICDIFPCNDLCILSGYEVRLLKEYGYLTGLGIQVLKICVISVRFLIDSMILLDESINIGECVLEPDKLFNRELELAAVIELKEHEEHSEVPAKLSIPDDIFLLVTFEQLLWSLQQGG